VPDITDYHVAGAAGSRSNRSERYVDVDVDVMGHVGRTPTNLWGRPASVRAVDPVCRHRAPTKHHATCRNVLTRLGRSQADKRQ
jgi:hypothetical protein